MGLLPKSKFDGLIRFFSKLPFFSRPDKHSLHFLNCAQFMGVLNDNIFKLIIAFLLIDIIGQQHASSILSLVGVIFVLPFLLFSSTAGTLADRFSKQRLMMWMKGAEMITMVLAMFAFGFQSVWGSCALLFLLSTHSAMFGPSKYAIIFELVPSEKVSSANGLITAFTYLGVILGTFLASFLTKFTHHNFVVVAGFCFVIAAVGFISTFGIRYTPPQGSKQKLNFLFIKDIYATLVFCRTRKHLLVAITGSAYFLFIGAFVQLNIIPYAITELHLGEVAGGYLFLSTALGIALGAYLGGKVSKKRVELGLSCFAGFFIAMFLFLLSVFPTNLTAVVIFLVFLGIFGGLFIVPFDSFVQLFSPDEKRGQIIAANNFLSFCGVLVAAVALYIFSGILGLSPANGFAVTGFFTLILSFLMISRLSDLALPFFARRCVKPFSNLTTVNLELVEKNPGAILIVQKATWRKAFLLLCETPNVHFLIKRGKKRRFPWFNWMFYSVHLIRSDETLQPLLDTAKFMAEDSINPCILVESDKLPDSFTPPGGLMSIFKGKTTKFLYVDISIAHHATTITFREKY
jgi:acyl-[acyl-carrier-protein]-phospholipid O-acyltransferase / long-chain-fatty-acid--[acyl-carrier-protein] ligase